jgi:adenylate kinase
MKNKPKHIDNFQKFKKNYGNVGSGLSSPVIIFVGPPGCGKGTQSETLSDKMGYVHVSTGDILRKSKEPEVKELMKTGKLLPDDLVGKELESFIKKNKGSKGFIFDGYPRNLAQKSILEKILDNNNLEISNIFYLDVPEKILKERIKERGKTSGRSDDKDPDVFKVRMGEYNDQTLPMIKSMKKYKTFREINGKNNLEEITQEILSNLDEI